MSSTISETRDDIQQCLKALGKQNNIKILFAAEAGSRAWGFESPQSDYDVRGIYARPIKNYLGLDEAPEQIDKTIKYRDTEIDISLWDIRKALKLFRKWNPTLWEWLRSPTIYKHGNIRNRLIKIGTPYNSLTQMNHYLHLSESHYQRFIESHEEIIIKKYLYTIRHIMCCVWIATKETPPPVPFNDLRLELYDNLSHEVYPNQRKIQSEIFHLLTLKKTHSESSIISHKPEINLYIVTLIERYSKWLANHKNRSIPDDMVEDLDKLFLETMSDNGLMKGKVKLKTVKGDVYL